VIWLQVGEILQFAINQLARRHSPRGVGAGVADALPGGRGPRMVIRRCSQRARRSSELSRRYTVAPVRIRAPSLCGEELELGLALTAQLGEVDLDAWNAARLGEHARLGLERLGHEHAAARGHRRIQA
jgi:hypothetical protein